jgi:hypothetical protein
MLETGFTFLTSGQMLAQSGAAKTMLGYVACLVLIAVGLSLVCRPSGRVGEKKKR